MSIFFFFLHISQPVPSWQAGRLWLFRIGLYKLIRPKQIADDWIWIIDHTVQLGCEKCLVILGIRQSELPDGENFLYHEDVEPIELIPVTQSNGKIVYQQLTNAVEKTGVPCQIVADHGSDLKAGIDLFCSEHPQTRYIYDIKHKVAALLKNELGDDTAWQEYTAACAKAAKQLQQTDLAHLMPPQQRTKARYLNIDPLVQWGQKTLTLLDALPGIAKELDLDIERVEQKLGWLGQYRQPLTQWADLMETVKSVEDYVKAVGIYDDCHIQLEQYPPYLPQSDRSKAVHGQLVSFIKEQALKAKPDERLLGSSEIVESVLGKLKAIEHDQVKGGFTGMILGLAACVGKTTGDLIEKALPAIPTKKMLDWVKENLPPSVQSRRKKLSNVIKSEEQKQTHFLTPCNT